MLRDVEHDFGLKELVENDGDLAAINIVAHGSRYGDFPFPAIRLSKGRKGLTLTSDDVEFGIVLVLPASHKHLSPSQPCTSQYSLYFEPGEATFTFKWATQWDSLSANELTQWDLWHFILSPFRSACVCMCGIDKKGQNVRFAPLPSFWVGLAYSVSSRVITSGVRPSPTLAVALSFLHLSSKASILNQNPDVKYRNPRNRCSYHLFLASLPAIFCFRFLDESF